MEKRRPRTLEMENKEPRTLASEVPKTLNNLKNIFFFQSITQVIRNATYMFRIETLVDVEIKVLERLEHTSGTH